MRRKILIVDDEIDSFGFVSETLEENGYSVVAIESGENAVKLVEKSFFDVVLLDFNLPGINGLETFRCIKQLSPLTIVVIMTAAAPEALLHQALAEGTYKVFFKPFKIDQMIDTIDDGLHRPTVLVLSDDAARYAQLGEQLTARNVRCVIRTDDERIVEVLRQKMPDAALVDFQGDRDRSNACIATLHEAYPDLALVSTADGNPGLPERVLAAVEAVKGGGPLPSVLLVEPDPSLSRPVAEALQDGRFCVVAVGTGKAAIGELEKKPYDAIIVDASLPDMSGIDVIRKLKEGNGNAIVILMTGHESLELAIGAIKERVFDFLVKPVDQRNLMKSLRKALRNRNN